MEINLAMTEVRSALKHKSYTRHQNVPAQEPVRQPTSHAQAMRHSHSRPNTYRASTFPTLAIHQTKRVSLFQMLSGLAMMYLGLLLVVNFSGKGPAQSALGVVLVGHGFSTSLLGVTLLCLKRPIITVTQSFIRILGMPRISLFHVADSRMTVTRNGSFLTISCTPEHTKTLPIHLRSMLKIRYLLRNHHFEFKASSLDAHPAHVIDMLDEVATTRLVRPLQPAQARPSGTYANALASACLGMALLRCLVQHDTSLSRLASYLCIFIIFRTTAIIQTVVLTPSR